MPTAFRSHGRPASAALVGSMLIGLSIASQPSPAAAADATLVRTINTAAWSSPSPDPSGIAYNSRTGRLEVVDGEVEETTHFEGVNAWETSLTGVVARTFSTLAYSDEPVGAAVNATTNHLYLADDDTDQIHDITAGADGQFGTGDDQRRTFSTTGIGSADPSGVTFALGDLFIADDAGTDIIRLDPGSNGLFDGGGDDRVVTRFDVGSKGQSGPEGVEYDPATNSLFIISNHRTTDLLQVTLAGAVLQTIDLAGVPIRAPGGLTLGPRSNNAAARSFYIADRGIDNVADPGENDGRIFEIAVPTTPFTDIATHPFRGDIQWLFGSGITRGCAATRFCPDLTVTREQMASFLARALALPAATRDFFTDDNNSAHEADINRVAAAGIAAGCGSGRYCPTRAVTREQMASFLARAYRLPATTRDFFSDDNSSAHEGDINRVAAAGVAAGCGPGRYCPRATVTRGQMAAFLHRAS